MLIINKKKDRVRLIIPKFNEIFSKFDFIMCNFAEKIKIK